MRVYDAEFYPIMSMERDGARTAVLKKRSGQALKLAALLLSAVLLILLAVRAGTWTEQQHEVEELLVLVNPWNPVEYSDFKPRPVDLADGHQIDARCAGALEEMLSDCAAAGNRPVVCSAYRTRDFQQQLFDNKVQRVIASGVSPEEAPDVAAREVARPGTSEHELGLAVDIVDESYQLLDQGQEDTATQKWLMANSWRYGFILRYPTGASDITGIIYEPWHYRYVGREAAGQIYQLGVTLEEYLSMFYSEEAVVRFED